MRRRMGWRKSLLCGPELRTKRRKRGSGSDNAIPDSGTGKAGPFTGIDCRGQGTLEPSPSKVMLPSS